MDIERGPAAARAASGWHNVLRRQMPALERWAQRISGDHEAADVAQEAVLRLLEAGPEGIEALRAWLFRAALTVVIDRARRRKVRQAAKEALAWVGCGAAPRTPEASALVASVVNRLASALGQLPEPRREAFIRVRLGGEAAADLAREYQVSSRTVERWVERATEHCRTRVGLRSEDLAA